MSASRPVILMYHAISQEPKDPDNLCVSPERFEDQMLYLRRRGCRGVSVGELLRAAAGNAERLVGLTFDDGYENFLHNAIPVLEKVGFTATVFVLGGMLGKENNWGRGEPRMRLLDADRVREVHDRGMEIGCHGMSHASLPALDAESLESEVSGGQRVLSKVLGQAVEGFSYPYGDLDAHVVQAVRRAGFGYACAYKTQLGRSRYDIPRIYVGERDGDLRLRLKLRWYRHYARLTRPLR